MKGSAMEILTFLLVLITALYAFITSQTLQVLEKQTRLSMIPTFLINIMSYENSMEEYFVEIKKDIIFLKNIKHLDSMDIWFVCSIQNLTRQPARAVSMFIYDSAHKLYSEAVERKFSFGEKEEARFYFKKPYINYNQLNRHIQMIYGKERVWISKYLAPESDSFAAIVFSDLEGTMYITKQEFYYDNDAYIREKFTSTTYTAKANRQCTRFLSTLERILHRIRC
jgi:hypothetical protein